jgi:hypothetical protein
MYLNHRAILQCVHGGQVMLFPPPLRSLWIMQSPVVTETDLMQAIIIGCPQVGPGLKPCTKITAILMGRSLQIQIDGEVPILDSLRAMTDGGPPGIVSAINDGSSNCTPAPISIQAVTMMKAARTGAAFCPT